MPFVKGQSGNPRGRPKKGSPITAFLRHQAGLPHDGDERKTKAEALAEVLFTYALNGDMPAAKAILDRLDGPVTQPVQHSGPEGGPVILQWAEAEPDANT